jgi:dienelactone hydrolase
VLTSTRGESPPRNLGVGPTALFLLFSWAVPVNAEPPAIWAGLRPGEFRVGYCHLPGVSTAFDLWYPTYVVASPLTFQAYLGNTAESFSTFLTRQGLSATSVEAFLNAPVYATSEPTAAPGRFPLVLLAQGNGEDAADQAVLAEFLASYGYVVASAPSPMIHRPMTEESQIGEFADLQERALEEAVGMASAAVNARTARMAVIGHSFGARAALLLAMEDRRVRALVSLDGGIGTTTGTKYLETASSFHAERQLPPTLHVYEKLDEFMKPDFTFLTNLHIRILVLVEAHDMHHIHFTSYGFASAILPEVAAMTRAGQGIRENVATVANKVREFVDQQLR